MARRRINFRFLGIVVLIVVGLGVAVFFGRRLMRRANPQTYIVAAQQYERQQQWGKAADALGLAIERMPKDATLRVERGKDLVAEAPQDPEKRSQAVLLWRRALEIDPSNIEARHLLLGAYGTDLDILQGQPKTDANRDELNSRVQAMSDMASQLAQLDPSDINARTILPSLTIRLWLMDMPIPLTAAESALPYDKRPSDEQKVNAAIATLAGLLHADPSDADAGLWIARAKIHQAQLLQQNQGVQQALSDPNAAPVSGSVDKLLSEAAHVFDQPIAQRPKLPQLYDAKAQVMWTLFAVEQRPDVKAKDFDGLRDALDHAQAMVDPANPVQWLQIKMEWARVLGGMPDTRARGEAVYRDIIAKMPNEVGPKVALAELLASQPGRLKEALALLEQLPDQPPVDLSPTRRAIMGDALQGAKEVRVRILTDELRETKDPAQRQALAQKANALLADLAPERGERWQFLKLKGSLQLAQGPGHYRDAAQTLDAAVSKMKVQTAGVDPGLLLLEADAYQSAGQDGDAASVLEQAMNYPQVNQQLRPHEVLANLYIKQHNPDKVGQQIDWLVNHAPADPDVIKLQILALDPASNPANRGAAMDLFARLPEHTELEMQQKASIAQQQLNDSAQVERLYKAILAMDPGNVLVASNLSLLYANSGRHDQAMAVLNAVRKLHPDDPTLALITDDVQGARPADLVAAQAQLIRKDVSDPFKRELELAELAGRQNDLEGELLHLKNAQSYNPSSPQVLAPMFGVDLATKRFDDARALLAPLAKADADGAHGGMLRFQYDTATGDKAAAMDQAQQLVAEFPQFASAWLSLGDALAAAGRYDDATAKYLQALDKQGVDAPALRGLIACSYATNKIDDAKRYIQQGRQQFPNDPVFRQMEVEHELRYGDPDTVVPELLDQVKQHPDVQQNYAWAAQALARSAATDAEHADADGSHKRLQQEHDLLADATARWPDNIDFAAALAQTCVQQQDTAGAEAALKTLAARPVWQGQPAPQMAMADMYVAAGRPADAEAALRRAINESKNPVPVELQLARVLASQRKFQQALAVLENDRAVPQVVNERAELLLGMGKGQQAEAEVLAALGGSAAVAPAPTTQASAVHESLQNVLVSIYYQEHKLSEASALATNLILADPNDISPHYYRAMANLKSHQPDPDAAIADLTFVRDRQPTFIDARLALAEAYVQKNDTDSAAHELEAAEHAVPGNKAVRLQLVELYSNSAPPRLIEAQQVLEEALAMPLNKNDVDLLRNLAVVQAKRGQSDAAVATIRQAMSVAHDQAPLEKDYLHILLLNKNYPLLIEEANTLTASPSTAPWWAYDYRAQAKALSGDRDGAMSDFDLAMRQAPLQGGGQMAVGVAIDAANALGVDAAISLVNQRDSNDTMWKLIALSLYDRKGDHAAAMKIAESAMASMDTLSPADQDELLNEAGSLYLTANPPMTDKAVAVLQKVLQRHPDDLWAMNNLACVLAEDVKPPQPQQALVYSTKAYNAVQRSGRVQPLIYDTQGWVLILAGKVDQGIDVLQKIGDSADFADLHYHLGEAYLRKKLPESAQHELQTASDMLDQATAAGKSTGNTVALREKVNAALKQVQALSQDKAQAEAIP